MTEFLISLAAFLAAHVLPTRTGLRDRAIARIGRAPYMAGYSVLSLGLVVWVISAALRAPYVALWSQAPWQTLVPVAVMPVALVLLAAGLVQPNPLSISLVRAADDQGTAGIVRVTRHPVLWGFGLWALTHIPPNGDLVSVVLFGGLCLFAFAGMASLDRRRRRVMGEAPWAALARDTSLVPFAAILSGRNRLPADARTLVAAAIGFAAYVGLLLGGHVALFGVDPLAAL